MEKTYIKQLDGEWYAFAADADEDQVFSIGRDNPSPQMGKRYCAPWTNRGIKIVSTPSPSRAAALKRAKRHGEFGGEI